MLKLFQSFADLYYDESVKNIRGQNGPKIRVARLLTVGFVASGMEAAGKG